MKTNWLKRTLVGVAASAALIASVAAYSEGNPFHHGPPSPEEMAAHEAHILARIGKSLDLNADQAAKLKVLADTLQAQRPMPPAPGASANGPREQMQALISGDKFDRAGAMQILNQKLAKLQTAGPALITAAGNFFDSLSPAQQQKVRKFAARHHGFEGWRGHGGPRDHGDWHGHDGEHGRPDPAGQDAPPPPPPPGQ